MLVDVIIPTYGDSPLLLQAVKSALAQGECVKSVIVVDDGSPPETVARISLELASLEKVMFISAPRYSNPAIIRNIGIKQATGRYLGFLDSDDFWLPGKLDAQISLGESKSIKFICTNALKVSEGGKQKYFDTGSNAKLRTHNLIRGNRVITSTVLVDREEFIKMGLFPEDYSVRGVEDYLAWLKLSLLTDAYYLNLITTEYLINPSGISQNSRSDHAIHALTSFLQFLKSLPRGGIYSRARIILTRVQLMFSIWAR